MARQQRAIETRDRIMDAAARLFAERGYRGTTFAEIAANAGVVVGAVQFHFPTKAAIAGDVIRQQHEIVLHAGRSSAGAGATPDLESTITISARLAHLNATNPVVRAGLRLGTDSIDALEEFASAPHSDWIDFSARMYKRAKAHGELQGWVDPTRLAETGVAGFTGVQFLSSALAASADLADRLAWFWVFLYRGVSVHEYDYEFVRNTIEREMGQPGS